MRPQPVFFVRHKFTSNICRELKDNNLIAYHYLDEFHTDLKSYSEISRGLTQTFNAFNYISKHRAIVAAEFDNPNEIYIGEIPEGEMLSRKDIGSSVYKTLRFNNPMCVSYSNYPLLAAIRPPFVTACEPGKSFSQIIRHIYLRENIEFATDSMHPSSIELMCESYLRSHLCPEDIRLSYTLLRVGRTMQSVDIYGTSVKGKKIFAQVTYGSGDVSKIKSLTDFTDGSGKTILFSKDKSTQADGLDYHFNIDDVFNELMLSDEYKPMLQEMVG